MRYAVIGLALVSIVVTSIVLRPTMKEWSKSIADARQRHADTEEWTEFITASSLDTYDSYRQRYPKGRYVEFVDAAVSWATRTSHAARISNSRTARIHVDQSYAPAEASDVRLPVANFVQECLRLMGVTLHQADDLPDLSVHVSVTGNAETARYNDGSVRYTGGSLGGTIDIEIPDGPRFRRSFKRARGTMPSISSIFDHVQVKTAYLRPDPVLNELLHRPGWADSDGDFGDAIVAVMEEMYGPRFLVVAADKPFRFGGRAAASLASKGTVALEPLLAGLRGATNMRWPLEIRRHAALAVDSLLPLLERVDLNEQRADIIGVLAASEDTRVIDPLARELVSPANPETAEAARAALETIGSAAVSRLIEILQGPSEESRWEAAKALVNIGDADAAKGVVAALSHPVPDVRRVAACALGNKPQREVTEFLIPILNDPEPATRICAIQSLGKIDDPRSIEPLFAAALDADEVVRGWAIVTLLEPTQGALANDSTWAGRPVVPTLVERLQKDPEDFSKVRGRVMHLLAVITGQRFASRDEWINWWVQTVGHTAPRPK